MVVPVCSPATSSDPPLRFRLRSCAASKENMAPHTCWEEAGEGKEDER